MNGNNKILISMTVGIGLGAILGILLSGEKEEKCKAIKQDKKFVQSLVENLHRKFKSTPGVKEKFEEAVDEAFAENPSEYI